MTGAVLPIIQIAILLLLAYVLGCWVGARAQRLFAGGGESDAKPVSADDVLPPEPEPAPKPETPEKPAAMPPDAEKEAVSAKPELLSAPRGGGKDDLKKIKGIGPKIEGRLNELGVYHFDQIAAWDARAAEFVNDSLSFKGRIEREQWVEQARLLVENSQTS